MAKSGTHKVGKIRPAPAGFWRDDLAAYLNRTPSGIDKLRSRGDLPKGITIGRAPFWPKEMIDRWLADKAKA
jgi:predicted DNA-binding transcriptional regulator AlpA